jgi:glycosyltransferase involved in cell wall biosynthesis
VKKTPLVSVIIPTFNRPLLLAEALKSVLSQTFTDFEAIIINDAGLDVSDVVEAFHDSRFTYLEHHINKGLPASRNTGIGYAKGKYIAYLDDDDVFLPEHLAILTTVLMNSAYKIAYTDLEYVYKKIEKNQVVTYDKKPGYSYPFNHQRLLVENLMAVMCVMHEKCCLDSTGLFNETLDRAEDWDLWIRISRNYPFVHIPLVTAQYVMTGGCNQMVTNWKGFYLNSILKIHAWYRNELVDEKMINYSQEYRKLKFAQSFEELKLMNNEAIEKLNLEKICKEIAENSTLNTQTDVKGAQILIGHLVQRLPEKAFLWKLYAKLSRLLGEHQTASIAESRIQRETKENQLS